MIVYVRNSRNAAVLISINKLNKNQELGGK